MQFAPPGHTLAPIGRPSSGPNHPPSLSERIDTRGSSDAAYQAPPAEVRPVINHVSQLQARLFVELVENPPEMSFQNTTEWASWSNRLLSALVRTCSEPSEIRADASAQDMCRMLEYAAVSRGQFPAEAETIRRVALMEPFVRLLVREVQALCLLEDSPEAFGFFAPADRVLEGGPKYYEREPVTTRFQSSEANHVFRRTNASPARDRASPVESGESRSRHEERDAAL